MVEFEVSATCRAPATEVWALLYDPARLADWWVGTERIEGERNPLTRYTLAEPGVPYPTALHATRDGSRVTISCLAFDIAWEWTLEPAPEGCAVHLRMRGADEHADLVDRQRGDMRASVARLVALAEAGVPR
ncbi:MAG TPA: SRPBCC family protein [Capillimicrobium sp.]|nr:SRPBCC family protein [Capillimicrobium sp.]